MNFRLHFSTSFPFHPSSAIHQPVHCTGSTLVVSSFPSQPSFNNPSTCILFSLYPGRLFLSIQTILHQSINLYTVHCTVSTLAVSSFASQPSFSNPLTCKVYTLALSSFPFQPSLTIHQPVHCTVSTLAVSSFPSQPSFNNPSTCILNSLYPGRLFLSFPTILHQSINLYTVQSPPWPSPSFHPNHPSAIHQPLHCTVYTLAVSLLSSTCTVHSRLFLSIPTISLAIHSSRLFISIPNISSPIRQLIQSPPWSIL